MSKIMNTDVSSEIFSCHTVYKQMYLTSGYVAVNTHPRFPRVNHGNLPDKVDKNTIIWRSQ